MKSESIDITQPEDVPADRDWGARHADALGALQRARARQALLAATLARDPAAATLAALAAAQAASAGAGDALAQARDVQTEAQKLATQFEANDVAQAQQALDDATAAESRALAQLLREASTSTALTATVDGLALRARYQTAIASTPPRWDLATIPFLEHTGDAPRDPQLRLPSADDPDYVSLIAVLDRLDERVDAVADLVTAEGVHQLVGGNLVRSGAALDIAASGTVPDELEVIRTPQPGRDLTHRVLALQAAGGQPRWTADHPCVAATADPELTAWVSALIPDPARVQLVAERLDPETGAPTATVSLTADQLGLDPLAWLALAADPAELTARVARLARASWAATGGPHAHGGRVIARDPDPRDPTRLALTDLLCAADSVRGLLATARALTDADLVAPVDQPAAPDAAAVKTVVANVREAEKRVETIIDTLDAATTATDPEPVLDALLAASAVGISEATPPPDADIPELPALQAMATVALTRLRTRTAGGPAAGNLADPAPTLERARERLVALCGSRQPLLVALAAPQEQLTATDLGGAAPRIAGADGPALRAWLHDHARVRPACAALQRTYDLAETLGCPGRLDLRATQLPLADPARWVEDDPAAPAAAVDMVVARAYSRDLPTRVTGLALDAWTSTVPTPTHATGLAFHYDEPDATPPQAILVAVAPDVSAQRQPATWDLDTLLDVVRSTFTMASERAVAAELWHGAAITLPDGT